MKTFQVQIPEGYEIDKEQSTFENIVFKKKPEFPTTWEACIDKLNDSKTKFCHITSGSELYESYSCPKDFIGYNTLPSKEIAKKFLILQKLYTCRQAYIEDWKPDWSDSSKKYVIVYDSNKITIEYCWYTPRSFSFPSRKMAEEFLKNFKAELEQVKDLI